VTVTTNGRTHEGQAHGPALEVLDYLRFAFGVLAMYDAASTGPVADLVFWENDRRATAQRRALAGWCRRRRMKRRTFTFEEFYGRYVDALARGGWR
jgi:hypothetical protein